MLSEQALIQASFIAVAIFGLIYLIFTVLIAREIASLLAHIATKFNV